MPARPEQDGEHRLSLLADAWDKAAQRWRDDMASHFDTYHWQPLREESLRYLDALRRLADVLEEAERGTEDEGGTW